MDKDFLGVLVFYIDVGQLPQDKADALVEEVKNDVSTARLKLHYELVFLPVRRPNSGTKVEFIKP